MPLPPRPRKRFEGRFDRPAPARREPTRARLGAMVREHEEEEKPFEPERRGSWRGSARELVVNPDDFLAELKKLVLEEWRLTTAEYEEAVEILDGKKRPDMKMRELDTVLDTHGVEAIPPSGMDTKYLYLNTGDTYNATIIYSYDDDKFFVSTMGDIVEEHEPKAEDEAWSDWMRADVERCVRRDIEHNIDLSEAEQQKLLELFDDFDDDELKKIFRESVNDVKGAEIVHESDGSVFVHRFKEVCSEASDRVITILNKERSPNARRSGGGLPSMGAEDFVQELKARVDFYDRMLRFHLPGQSSQLILNFYNVDPKVSNRDDAEAENNRLMFVIAGFGKGPNIPPPSGKVKLEHTVSSIGLDRGNELRTLRGKTGTTEQVLDHLAKYLRRVIAEVPPRYTHTLTESGVLEALRETGGRATIADLWDRMGMAKGSKKAFDELLLRLQQEQKLVLMKNDNTMDITERDERAAIHIAGHPRHIVYLQQRSNASSPQVEVFTSRSRHIDARVRMGGVEYEKNRDGEWEAYGGEVSGARITDPSFIAELDELVNLERVRRLPLEHVGGRKR